MKKLEKENSGKEEPLFEEEEREKLIEENLMEEEIENLTKAGYSRDQIAWVGKQRASNEKFEKKTPIISEITWILAHFIK